MQSAEKAKLPAETPRKCVCPRKRQLSLNLPVKSPAAVAGNAAQASPLSYMVSSSRLLVFVVLWVWSPRTRSIHPASLRASQPRRPRTHRSPISLPTLSPHRTPPSAAAASNPTISPSRISSYRISASYMTAHLAFPSFG